MFASVFWEKNMLHTFFQIFWKKVSCLFTINVSWSWAGPLGRPEPTVQELVTAVVVKRPESEIEGQNITDWVSEKLEDSKKLRGGVIFVQKLPKTPQGKLQRRELAKLYSNFYQN